MKLLESEAKEMKKINLQSFMGELEYKKLIIKRIIEVKEKCSKKNLKSI